MFCINVKQNDTDTWHTGDRAAAMMCTLFSHTSFHNLQDKISHTNKLHLNYTVIFTSGLYLHEKIHTFLHVTDCT